VVGRIAVVITAQAVGAYICLVVSATPRAEFRALGDTKAILDEIEKGGSVTLRDEEVIGVSRPERSDLNVFFEPLFGKLSEVWSALIKAVVVVACDSGPGCETVLVPGVYRGDVEEVGECVADPSSRVVLVGDGVDPQFCTEGGKLFLVQRMLELEKNLRKNIGAAPD
jgi:hypothetical protein